MSPSAAARITSVSVGRAPMKSSSRRRSDRFSGSGETVMRERAWIAAHHPSRTAPAITTNCRKFSGCCRVARASPIACSSVLIPSRVEVRDQLALEASDLVLEQELALFQPAQLDLVHVEVQLQAMNYVVEVAVLDAQAPQSVQVLERLGVDVVRLFRHRG